MKKLEKKIQIENEKENFEKSTDEKNKKTLNIPNVPKFSDEFPI